MNDIVFLKAQFWVLVISSILIPTWLCWIMLSRKKISRNTVIAFGVALLLLAAVDLILMPILYNQARQSKSTADDTVFASSYSVALYLLPLISAGLGVNLISHMLRSRLKFADVEHEPPDAGSK